MRTLIVLALLLITGLAGCASVDPQPVAETKHPLSGSTFTWSPAFPDVGEEVTFDASPRTTAKDDDLIGILWTIEGTNQEGWNPTHSFSQAGEQVVAMTVQTAKAGTYTVQQNITVLQGDQVVHTSPTPDEPSDPEAPASPQISYVQNGSRVTFAFQWDRPAEQVFWDFGEGNSSTESHPTHIYAQKGNHTVLVRVAASDVVREATTVVSVINASSPSEANPRHFEAEEPSESCGSFGSLEPILPTEMDPTGAALGWELLQLDVVMIADPTFVEAHPNDWQMLLEELVDDASIHYEEQMQLRLNTILTERLPDGSLAPGSGDGKQRAVARGFMNTYYPNLDFDYVAVILGADYEGSVAGQVECVHGAVNQQNAYLWSEYDEPREPGGTLTFFEDTPLKVFMHETAHLLAAHHHYTQCGTTMTGYGPNDALAVCGTMINDIGLASYQFSQTNRHVMRSFVEEIGIGEPVS